MKTNYSLRFAIKVKAMINRLLILFFISQSSFSFATITIEIDNNNVYVRTDEVGLAGYKGCETGKLKQVKAYVYTLYRKENKSNKNTQTCSSSTSYKWVQVAKKESNHSEEEFPNMPYGEYKATVYAGQAIGCNINGDSRLPSKSIVYHQEKSTVFDLSNQNVSFDNVALTSNSTSNSDNDVMKVFPNPTNGELNIQIKGSQLKSKANIIFYDLLGREAMNINRSIEDSQYQEWQVDVSQFSEGAYILRVFDNEGTSYEKKVIVTDNK